MRRSLTRLGLLCVLAGIVGWTGHPRAAGPNAAFHAVGDLPDGGFVTIIRDATRAGGVIYAVGGAVSKSTCSAQCPSPDTPILWRFDGTNATLTPLPDLITPNASITGISANAITADGTHIASQARGLNGAVIVRRAVRVDTSTLATLNLNSTLAGTSASTISNDGTILYGLRQILIGGVPNAQAVRFDVTAGTTTDIPTPAGTFNPVALRGSSANGSVAVGSRFSNAPNDHRAYRFVQGTGTTLLPLLNGGSFSDALAVSPDGDLVLATGNSTAWPNGEAYLYRASTGAIQPIGSPNSAYAPGGHLCAPTSGVGCPPFTVIAGAQMLAGGMTADGSVVAMTFSGDGIDPYFHNAHGWWGLGAALRANGVDIETLGWSNVVIQGISPDGTLVFGYGNNGGNLDGFVAEFAPGLLASFNPSPAPPANTSIVGAWDCGDNGLTQACVLVFTADGVYYHIERNSADPVSGFEWGYYTYDGVSLSFITRVDTNGSIGANSSSVELTIAGDLATIVNIGTIPRIAGVPGTIFGAWTGGFPTQPDSSGVLVFRPGGTYLFAQDGSGLGSNRDSIEVGTFTWNSVSGAITPDASTGVDQNGDGGFYSCAGCTATLTLTANELGFVLTAPDGSFGFTRVIDPATVAHVSGGDVTATLGSPFSMFVAATHAFGFGATGLPAGLNINSVTGEISGTPAAVGFFPVTVSATNSYGDPKSATVNLTVVSVVPTTAGSGVTVTPEVPPGTPPVSMTFDSVTTGGGTTVAVLDADTAPPPPGGFQVGSEPLYYDIKTQAVLAPNSSVTICFNYAGVDFGGQTPRLFHYVNGAWVDITSSVDAATATLCGTTSSFSPFAIFSSATPFVRGTGFYAPVSPSPTFVNTSKAGSTVPLKFNVYVNGAEKRDVAGLVFSVTPVACAVAPEDPVDYVTQSDSNLRYDAAAGQFIQNWKTPKSAGCYIARITNADGLLLKATFSLK